MKRRTDIHRLTPLRALDLLLALEKVSHAISSEPWAAVRQVREALYQHVRVAIVSRRRGSR